MKQTFKKAWKWFKVIFTIYFLIGIALYFLQEKFLFHPKKLSADYQYKFDVPFRQLDLTVNKDKNLSVVEFTVPDSLRKGIVLYFHGNRENINRYAPQAKAFTRNGYEVWMMDYPGFGKSTGARNEATLYSDAKLIYDMALQTTSIEHIIIYGKSLGTGVAAQLASIRHCQRLILETPYCSIPALAKSYFLPYPGFLSKYYLSVDDYLDEVKDPVTIFHGTRDGVIPYRHAKRLAARHAGIQLVTIEGGKHNDLSTFPLFQQKIDSLMK